MLDINRALKIGRFGRIGTHRLHANHDAREIIRAVRDTFVRRFEDSTGPEGTLATEERLRRAHHLRRAHMAQLSLRGVAACQRSRAMQDLRAKGAV